MGPRPPAAELIAPLPSPDAPQDPIAVVEAFIAALERHDIDAAAAMCTDDVVHQNVPFPPTRTRRGLDRTCA